MKITKEQMARVFEEMDDGLPLWAAAETLDIHRVTLARYICAAKTYGFQFWELA